MEPEKEKALHNTNNYSILMISKYVTPSLIQYI